MKIENIDINKDILIIAEIGNNHEGNIEVAKRLIDKASKLKLSAIKFQTFKTDLFVCERNNKERYDRLKSFELSYKNFEELARVAKDCGIIFFSTPLDLESADFLNSIVPIFKIASGDNNFYPLIQRVASFGKPIILSSGISELNQIKYTKSFIENTWQNKGINQDLAILHCVSSYPVPISDANLLAISFLKEQLDCIIGYSDHCIGIEVALMSIILGARIIEKHFTLDKNYSTFRDHQLSADPEDIKKLLIEIDKIKEILGEKGKNIQNCEIENTKAIRRSIVAKADLKKGSIINFENITWMRPGNDLPPGDEIKVLGKEITKDIKIGEPIKLEFLK